MMNDFGFTEEIKEKILTILRSHSVIQKAVIFGSRAKNTYKIGSDVDLTIWQNPGSDVLAKLMADFEESSIPYFFDVLDYERISNEALRKEIDRYGKIFYLRGWREVRLGDVVILNYGKGLTAENRDNGDIPVYGSSGITGYHNEALVNEEGYVIGRKGTVGSIYYSPVPFCPIDIVYYSTKKDIKTDFKYFYYLLKILWLDKLNFDSAVPGLNRNMAYSLPILIPENVDEQRSIAAVLSSFDDKIELLREQNKTLEATAQVIFKEWFVNFNFSGATGKMIDSELSEIPEGWRVGKLGEVVNIRGGTTPSTKNQDYWNGDIFWTSPKDLSNSKEIFLLQTEKKITKDGLKKISSGLLPKETLLLSSRAPIGYLAITDIEVAINQGYIAFLPDQYFSNYYMFLWLKSNMDVVINSANGSTFLEISKSSFKNIGCIIPNEKTLWKFKKVIKPLFDKIRGNILQIQTLSILRDSLLPKLMKGEVRVKIGCHGGNL